MDLNKLLELLEPEQRDVIKDAIEAEKQRGIAASHKKNVENEKLRSRLKELGYDSEKYESFDAFKKDILSTKEKATESELTLAQLNDKLQDLTEKYNKSIETANKIKQERDGAIIKDKLKNALGNIYGSEYLIDNILLKNELTLVDNKIQTADGKTFEEYTNEILEANKDNMKSVQTTGTETLSSTDETTLSDEDKFIEEIKNGI